MCSASFLHTNGSLMKAVMENSPNKCRTLHVKFTVNSASVSVNKLYAAELT